jgi:hypothetical protein
MVRKLLVTRPHHDISTEYLHFFAKDTLKLVKTMSDVHATDLEGEKATRSKVEQCIRKESPRLIFLNGHGSKSVVCGHKDEIILNKENIDVTKGKIVYALACDCLEELGVLAVEKGTETFIGYKAQFMIVKDPSRNTVPDKDKNALPFRKACSTLINALIECHPIREALDLTRKEYERAIRLYGTSEDDPYGDTSLIRFALAWDLEFLGMEGNPDAYFH